MTPRFGLLYILLLAIGIWSLTFVEAFAQDPGALQQLPDSGMESVQLTMNGRNTELEVEDTDNPLILLQTSRGDMVFELFPEAAPLTIENFLGLAEGSKAYQDSRSRQQLTRPFYDGLVFHRIVEGFLIQGGSPSGNAIGGPGFVMQEEINARSLGLDRMLVVDSNGMPNPVLGLQSTEDFRTRVLEPLYLNMGITDAQELSARVAEIHQRLTTLTVQQLYELQGYRYTERVRSRPMLSGSLAMANHGPGSSGSQFFITLTDADWLNGRYTVFGRLRAGQAVLDSIASTPVDSNSRPVEAITIFSISRIRRVVQ